MGEVMSDLYPIFLLKLGFTFYVNDHCFGKIRELFQNVV